MSQTIDVGTIFNDVWSVVFGFLKSIVGDISSGLNTVSGGFFGAVAQVFVGWGQSFWQYGIWAPFMLVVVLAFTGMIAYIFVDAFTEEEKVASVEEELPI